MWFSKMIPREKFTELHEAFKLSLVLKKILYILMAQLKAMNGGEITAS